MPKTARRTSGPNVAANRKESYTKTSPNSTSKTDKENFDSKASSKSKALPKSDKSTNKGDYRDIHLDEVKGEVPYKCLSRCCICVECNAIYPLQLLRYHLRHAIDFPRQQR